ANSVVAVAAGGLHVQGAANGYGERCGNADLFSVIASLELKRGHSLLPDGRLSRLGCSARPLPPGAHRPLGARRPDPHAHAAPALVGNEAQAPVRELAGRGTVEAKAADLGLELASDPS